MAIGTGQEMLDGSYDDTDIARKLMSLLDAEPQVIAVPAAQRATAEY